MQPISPPLPPRVGVQLGRTLHPAVPVRLDGHAAAVLMRPVPSRDDPAVLRLDWQDGRRTELPARVTSYEDEGRVACLDICGVEGDWRPFLAYVARGVA
jgi:hypothetical protein